MKSHATPIFLALVYSLVAGAAQADQWEKHKWQCDGSTLKVSARLMDIAWGKSWEDACAVKSADGKLAGYGASGTPHKCVNVMSSAMWGEWLYPNADKCKAKPRWIQHNKKCSSPTDVVISARLQDIPWGQSWETHCEAMQADAKLLGLGASGTPDNCVNVLSTGIYGEWTHKDEAYCGTDIASKVHDAMMDKIVTYAEDITTLIWKAQAIDEDKVAKNSMIVAESRYNSSSKDRDYYQLPVTVMASPTPDGAGANWCIPGFKSWSLGVAADANMFTGVGGESGMAFRCGDHTWDEKDSKWYASTAVNMTAGGGGSGGVTASFWVDEFYELAGDSHGYTLDLASAVGAMKVLSVSTAFLDALEDAGKASAEVSLSVWFARENDKEVGRFLGVSVTVSKAAGLGLGGAYSKARTYQFAE